MKTSEATELDLTALVCFFFVAACLTLNAINQKTEGEMSSFVVAFVVVFISTLLSSLNTVVSVVIWILGGRVCSFGKWSKKKGIMEIVIRSLWKGEARGKIDDYFRVFENLFLTLDVFKNLWNFSIDFFPRGILSVDVMETYIHVISD